MCTQWQGYRDNADKTSIDGSVGRQGEGFEEGMPFFTSLSPSALRPVSCVGHRVWILLAMTHLTLDFSVCSPLSQGMGVKLTPKSVPRSRPRWQPLWDAPNKLHWRTVSPLARRLLNPIPPPQDNRAGIGPKVKSQKHRKPAHKGQAACKECLLRYSQMEKSDPLAVIAGAPAALSSESRGDAVRLLLRARRQLKWDSYDKSQEGRTTTVAGFIDWGPTGTDSIDDNAKQEPNATLTTKVSSTTVAATPITTTRLHQRTLTVGTTPEPKRLSTTKATVSVGETVKPPKPYGDTPGLAVHQIITITVSLIMVIAALITTLVLKNCCAQSGNGRHNSHQRKIHQQEESCQNLTDFTPARVPSKVDIFTAYNDSLQCSHECVRTAVPIYTDEMIQQTPVYKTAYNGNRPSPTERQLIPVAFVSEKWFEISC
ncbi:adherens junction-associated protein 1 [Anoplopoma fimbria]|uniref:adherens junction-associated protein 1 n=1 Tax=Anoplopoma fimbria TaxID=229290 RepID=UPI0023EDA291|nr:adherens junction-associated protein 1 [Anoplopoma fimbria]